MTTTTTSSSTSTSSKQKIRSVDQRIHVLTRPNIYIGNTNIEEINDYIFDEENKKIVKKNVKYSTGLLKILKEALDNAMDNIARGKQLNNPCTYIKINWDITSSSNEDDEDDEKEDEGGLITIENDGPVVSIVKHKREANEPADVEGVYEPELVFGRLMSGSNFDDTEERLTVGQNGVGVSLLNIFSKYFKVEIHDKDENKSYKQIWRDNMSKVEKPIIKKMNVKKNMIRVSFKPEYERFGYKNGKPDENLYLIFKKNVYDASMLTKTKLFFNEEKISIDSLFDYAELYFKFEDEEKEIKDYLLFSSKTTTTENSRCLIIYNNNLSDKSDIISFANGSYTSENGYHVNEWIKKIFTPLLEVTVKKSKNESLTVDKLSKLFWIFIDTRISKPEFSSQTKTKLVGPKFQLELTEKDNTNIKKILKWEGYMDDIDDLNKEQQLKILKKTTSKTRTTKIEGYERANWAGTKKCLECTLIITEGLSAKTYASRGIGTNKNTYGILPIRGKFLNTYKCSPDKIAENKVIINFIQALNLKFDLDYTNIKNRKTLNYGKVMLCCDADTDGFHIEGLVICFLYKYFETLFKNDEPFLLSHRTPIIRCKLGKTNKNYYSRKEFEQDEHSNKIPKNVKPKYFKGLGTHNAVDIKETWGKRIIKYEPDEQTDKMLRIVFGKDSEERKKWLDTFDPNEDIGNLATSISVFLDKQLIKFSIEDCARSIPNMVDGLKESQRKVLYTCLSKNITKESMKVAQLSSLAAQFTDYKHGEKNLNDTIINMAQTFTGSNNLPLFVNDGEFGSEYEGGKDASDGRYIFTKLYEYVRLIFRQEDELVLEENFDEGQKIEYKYYVPIIPFALFNGCSCGIGTGYSSNYPNYNPEDICNLILMWIDSKQNNNNKYEYCEPLPWYQGFKGKIIKDKTKPNRYISYGIIEEDEDDENIIHVNTLPIGYWGSVFKDLLEDLLEKKKIKKYELQGDGPDDTRFIIHQTPDFDCNIESLKLFSYLSTSNIVCFNKEQKLKKYTIQSWIEEWCEIRLDYYNKRVNKLLDIYKQQLLINTNKYKFMNDVSNEKIKIFNIEQEDIEHNLSLLKYDKVEDSYNYLFELKFLNITKKQLNTLNEKINELKEKIKYYENTTVYEIWRNEINELIQKI